MTAASAAEWWHGFPVVPEDGRNPFLIAPPEPLFDISGMYEQKNPFLDQEGNPIPHAPADSSQSNPFEEFLQPTPRKLPGPPPRQNSSSQLPGPPPRDGATPLPGPPPRDGATLLPGPPPREGATPLPGPPPRKLPGPPPRRSSSIDGEPPSPATPGVSRVAEASIPEEPSPHQPAPSHAAPAAPRPAPATSPSAPAANTTSRIAKSRVNPEDAVWIKKHTESGSNTIRVFFSSPFGGMEKERDLLTKLYFLELRVMCEQVGLTFVPIDLRWGITEANATDALVIEICLREIDRSDIFVGFYGARYGWHGINDKLLMQNYERAQGNYPWINDFRERAVTELEFIGGHFRCLGEKGQAFYFRDLAYDEKMRQHYAALGETRSANKFSAESDNAVVLRDALKQQVLDTAATCLVRKSDYKDPEEGAQLMYMDLKKALQPRIDMAAREKKDRLGDAEAAQHEINMHLRAKMFVGGEEYFAQIDNFLATKSEVVVKGIHGTGKTSLIANWLLRTMPNSPWRFVYHFVGCSSKSTMLVDILQRLIKGLGRLIGETIDTGEMDVSALTAKFAETLETVGNAVPDGVCVVIDALDEMQPEHHAHELAWLPERYHPNIKIVVTTAEPEHIDERRWSTLEIRSLPRPTLEQIMENLLKARGKELSEKQKDRILGTDACGNALFLIVLVTELCQFGDFFQLDSKIGECLAAKDVTELYCIVLRRLDEDFADKDEPESIIARIMGALRCARAGLSEMEIQESLNINAARWARVFFAVEDLIMARSGLYCIRRKQLQNAVKQRYLQDPAKERSIRQSLATYFEGIFTKHMSFRVVTELPYQYEMLGDRDRLRATITHNSMFGALCTEMALGNYDLLRFWRAVGDSPEQIAAAYMRNLEAQVRSAQGDREALHDVSTTCVRVGQYLAEAGHLKEALLPFNKALGIIESLEGPSSSKLADILKDMGRLANSQGDYSDAISFYERALKIATAAHGSNHVSVANIQVGLAIVFRATEDYPRALQMLQPALKIYTQQLGMDAPDVGMALNIMAEIYQRQQDYQTALGHFQKALSVRERTLGMAHPTTATTAANLGTTYMHLGDFASASKFHDRALRARLDALGDQHPEVADSFYSIGLLEMNQGNAPAAVGNVEKSLAILERNFGPDHLALCDSLDRLGELYQGLGGNPEAKKYFGRSLSIKEARLGPESPALLDLCDNIARLAMEEGDMKTALGLISRAYDIARAAFGDQHPATEDALNKRNMLKKMVK